VTDFGVAKAVSAASSMDITLLVEAAERLS
jgi:hypothetical protein